MKLTEAREFKGDRPTLPPGIKESQADFSKKILRNSPRIPFLLAEANNLAAIFASSKVKGEYVGGVAASKLIVGGVATQLKEWAL